jgi:hydroxyethylthiazole kinase
VREIADQIARDLEEIRKRKPLLHHITNFVVMNETANVTLCLGALPVMAHAQEEVEEMVQVAGALVLNIGTLTAYWIKSMILAGKKANELGIPIVLDPVGAGATSLRTESTHRLLDELKIDVIRGNAAEVSILAGFGGKIKGVESVGGQGNTKEVAKSLASERECVVAITGREDIVSDGKRLAVVRNGDAMLSTITGTGCMATTVIGGFCAVNRDYFAATVGGLVVFGLAGEKAAAISQGKPGTFHVSLYDSLASLASEDIYAGCKVEVGEFTRELADGS